MGKYWFNASKNTLQLLSVKEKFLIACGLSRVKKKKKKSNGLWKEMSLMNFFCVIFQRYEHNKLNELQNYVMEIETPWTNETKSICMVKYHLWCEKKDSFLLNCLLFSVL